MMMRLYETVLGVLNVPNMPEDASLAYWALFFDSRDQPIAHFFSTFSAQDGEHGVKQPKKQSATLVAGGSAVS